MKKFNTTGICNPDRHYMVDISERIISIKALVDTGKYFCINRARQYGKTTTLSALTKLLASSYSVIFLDFQGIGQSGFETEEKFVQEFSRLIWNRRRIDKGLPAVLLDQLNEWKNDKIGLSTGYMVSFNFNKNKKCGVERINIGDKVLFEATV